MSEPKTRKKYEWQITPERRAALNAERVVNMKAGKAAKRSQPVAPVNTTDVSTKD